MIKSKILIGVMALALVGGVGSAFALTRNSATKTGTSPAFDEAIYLYWGHDESTATLADIESVTVNEPQYRYLTVSPKSTKSVSGTVTLSFTLAAATDCVVTGLTVKVYETASLANDSTVAGLIEGKSAVPSLSASSLTGSTTFNVATAADVHETQKFYAIEVKYDGSAKTTLGGTVTIRQSFAAA